MSFDFLQTQNILFWIVAVIAVVTFFIQLYYYLFVFRKVGLKKNTEFDIPNPTEPVSVIICVQNEADNLKHFIPLILEQNYTEYEVVIVSDSSTDDSDDILEFAKGKYQNLEVRKLIAAGKPAHGKSVVLGVGIKAAKYDKIILTDSNCRPGKNWLKSIAAGLNKSDIVFGYTKYTATKFVRTANFFESLLRLGNALAGKPYISTGENSGFNKELFFSQKGFNSMLRKQDKVEQVFFNSVSDKENTAVVLLPDAINESSLKLSFKDWCMDFLKGMYSQRLFRKNTRHKRLPEIISRTLFYLSIPVAVYFSIQNLYILGGIAGLFLIRLLIQAIIFNSAQKVLTEEKLVLRTIFWDFYSIPVYFFLFLSFRRRKSFSYS